MARRDESTEAIFAAKGQMAALMRAFDWSSTSLGGPGAWPQSLRSALSICLNTCFPICIYWGPEHILLYNDAWSAILGDKHPWALGRPAHEVWSEIWDLIGARFARVMGDGEAVSSEDELLPMRRRGYTEECYFNFTISPIRGEDGVVAGIFNSIVETSKRVISERRALLLRKLAEGMAAARSTDEACARAASLLASSAEDAPFCLIYQLVDEGCVRRAQLAAAAGLAADSPARPDAIVLDGEGESPSPWPLQRALGNGGIEIVDGLDGRFGVALPGGAWPEPVRSAAIIPIRIPPDIETPAYFLILGVSPRRTFDEDYRSFAELVAGSMRNAIARARAYEEEQRRTEEHQAIVDFALNRVHEAAYLIDDDSRLLYVNDEAVRSSGYSREELLRMGVPDIDADFPIERWRQYLREVTREGSRTFERCHKTKDGRIFPVEINTNYFTYRGGHYSMALVRDISERKRAEEELRKKTEELDRFFTIAQDLFCIASTDGYFLRLNPAWEHTLGYTLAELLARPFYDFIHPEDVARTREAAAALAAQKDVVNFPNRYRCKDGSYRWIEWRAAAVGDRIYAAARDITERKRAEEELQAASERRAILEFSLNQVHEAAFLVDKDSNFLYVNDEAIRALGYGREEFLRMRVPDIDPNFPAERWPSYWREVKQEGVLTFESSHKAKDGRIIPVELTTNYFEYGGRAYTMGLARDISERKRAEEELRKTTDELDRFFTIALDLLCIASTDGYFLRLNPAWEQTLGYTLDELKQRRITDFIHRDDVASTRRAIAALAAQREVVNSPNRYRCKDGSYRWIEWRSIAVGDRIYAAARDITERKRQERDRLAHLKYFESMDRINRAIQATDDLEQMMSDVLGAVLSIFDCDRAWLLHPCDPEADFWGIPMERTRPEYPGAFAHALEFPMDGHISNTCRTILAAKGPLQFHGTELWLASDLAKRYSVKSQISMAIYPKVGKPWVFGLHQCSHEHVWTPEEEKLFQEIGRRLSDGLSSLLVNRDLRKSEEKYREVFDNVSDSLILLDITKDGRFRMADLNPVAEKILGVSKRGVMGQLFGDAVSSDLAERCLPLFRRCVEMGEQFSCEQRFELAPGARFLRNVLLPVRNEAGSIYRLIALSSDITERKAAEQHLHLLMSEVNHRAKNLLAVVQAVARQTAGEDNAKLFAKRLEERIAALAASHDLLVKSEWRGVDVSKLVTSQLAHFKDLIGTRVILKGPPALLKPAAAQALGMALHELATNAGKYGALSSSKGYVRVEWEVAANSGGALFQIRWSERNGPPPIQPARHGFGQKVMVKMIEHALDADVTLAYPSSGLVWELAAPAERTIEAECAGASLLLM